MTTTNTSRLLTPFFLMVTVLMVAGCSSSQSTVVEPKSEIGQAVAADAASGSAQTQSAVVAADTTAGDSPVQQHASPAGTTVEPVASPPSSPSPLSSPAQQNSPAAAVPAVNELQPPASAAAVPAPSVAPPPAARKLIVDRRVTVDLGRTSGKVVVQ